MPGSDERRNPPAPTRHGRPHASSTAQGHQHAGTIGPASTPDGLRILIVEDETSLGRAAARVLARDGHEAVAVESAEEALVVLGGCDSRQSFDVVISDVGLPGMSGWQLAFLMRASYPDVAIVITSGWAVALSDDEMARLGIAPEDFVSKPYSRDDLRRVLASVASRRDRPGA